MDGNQLQAMSTSMWTSGEFKTYVAGVYDTHLKVTHCPPKRVSLQQASDVVAKYLQDHPTDRHEPAAKLTAQALAAAWPCQQFSVTPNYIRPIK